MGKKKAAVSSVPTTSSVWDADSPSSRVTTDFENDEDEASVIADLTDKDSLEVLDERSDVEKKLFEIIASGDYQAVRNLLNTAQGSIDVSHKDLLGHDVLTHVVESGQKKMINLILSIDSSIDVKEALLHAIKDNKMDVVLKFLYFEDTRSGGAFYATTKRLMAVGKARKEKTGGGSGKDKMDSFDQSEYGNDITPLIMAAMHGHYEIMQVLYNRGERLPPLHLPSCACSVCKRATRDLERTSNRLHLLGALSNPMYMIFMASQDGSFDPVYETFQLYDTLTQCAKEEPEYKKEYEELQDKMKMFPRDLMNQCRTVEETKTFLAQRQGYVGPNSTPFPRLALAIDRGHQHLVAHPNVQFLVQNEYYGQVWKSSKNDFQRVAKSMVAVASMLAFPLVQLVLWLSACCCNSMTPVRYLLSPHSRSISKLGSYLFFCGILFCMNMEERAPADIEPPTKYIRFIVLAYVVALSASLIRRFFLNFRAFFRVNWNIFEGLTLICFWIAFLLWIPVFARKLGLGFEETVSRRKLPANDYLLISECAFAIASTFATLRVLRWFILHRIFGPFQAALFKMGFNVAIVIVFVVWTIATFTVSSNILFRPYRNLTKYDEKEKREVSQPMDITEVDTMATNYFTGSLGPDKVEIFTVNRTFINADGKTETVENQHHTTQLFATFMCVMWNVVAMAFLKDSIVGLFGSTGNDIEDAKEIEWKTDYAKEILYYIDEPHLAPPFNLLPSRSFLTAVFGWLMALTCRRGGEVEAGCCYLRDVESQAEQEEQEKLYPWLLRNLFLRYFKENDDEKKEATKQVVEGVHSVVRDVRKLCEQMAGNTKSVTAEGSLATDTGVWYLMDSKDKPVYYQ